MQICPKLMTRDGKSNLSEEVVEFLLVVLVLERPRVGVREVEEADNLIRLMASKAVPPSQYSIRMRCCADFIIIGRQFVLIFVVLMLLDALMVLALPLDESLSMTCCGSVRWSSIPPPLVLYCESSRKP